jgi:archaellum component FlaC
MGNEDASVEYLKACLILRGLARCCQSSGKILDETALRMRMEQLVAESSVQEQLQRIEKESAKWEIVEHSAQSIKERVRIHEWHKELQAALEERRNFVREVEVELSSALRDLQEVLDRPQLKAKICDTLAQTKSSTNELNKLNTVLENSRKSLKDRRERFRSLGSMSKDLRQVHTALSEDLEIANPALIRAEIEELKASGGAHCSLQGIQRDLDDTKIVLHKTVKAVLYRGESIDELTDKSYHLSNASQGFKTQVRRK